MVAPLAARLGGNSSVLVGPQTGDDAGVYLQDGTGLVATVDFIPPVCDDPRRYGRVAAANSVSDVYAMGGTPLFALNICCFPCNVPADVLAAILAGGADVLHETGTALLGGHTVKDDDLKFGLAVVGRADPRRLLTNAGARPDDRLILTKPIGTGVMINAFRGDELDAAGLEPALVEMERVNATASRLALEHGARAATDITGFGLAGHALAVARASGVGLRLRFGAIPVHAAFFELVARGVTTGATEGNREAAASRFEDRARLSAAQLEVLFDPQTSGGLLVSVPRESAGALLGRLLDTGHRAAEIGEVLAGPPRLSVV
jgi:selenide,water dikinase